MTNKSISRREFMKVASLAGISLPVAKVVSEIDSKQFLASAEYGGFLVKKAAPASGDVIDPEKFEKFNQNNDAFHRMYFNEEYQMTMPPDGGFGVVADPTKPGYRREDLALSDASWTVANAFGTNGGINDIHGGLYQLEPLGRANPEPWDRSHLTDEEVTQYVKKAALFYGASLVGITQTKDEWFYSAYSGFGEQGPVWADIKFTKAEKAEYLEDNTLVIPDHYKTCIVLAYEMDFDSYQLSPGALASAGTGNGYSRMAATGACLAEFIRSLGFGAVACGNNTALSVPLAIEAGIGEKSKSGLLVTPKYGPRVRLNKIFTDMPLNFDSPISFGVEEFCTVCGKCVEHCPSGALKDVEQSYDAEYITNIDGVYKWHQEMDSCLRFWMKNGSDCSICVQVCPFNKPESWLHDVTRILIGAKVGPIDSLMVNLDDASGFGKDEKPDEKHLAFWKSDNFVHIK